MLTQQFGDAFREHQSTPAIAADRASSPTAAGLRQYSFTPVPRHLDEFAPMCHYHQTSPESPFTRK